MSKDWVKDIHDMHDKYGVHQWMALREMNNERELLQQFLDFRIKFLKEELDETSKAVQDKDPEEIVDAFGVDAHKAWDEVLKANMSKKVGVKESRPNPLGLPDLIKPDDWKAPSHEDNHDLLDHTF